VLADIMKLQNIASYEIFCSCYATLSEDVRTEGQTDVAKLRCAFFNNNNNIY